jgi:hypothetical protein
MAANRRISSETRIMSLLIVATIVFLVNIPFGYWRASVRKLSFQWALAIHLPVPFVVLLRLNSGIGFHFATYPVLIGAFFAGQQVGAMLRRSRQVIATEAA